MDDSLIAGCVVKPDKSKQLTVEKRISAEVKLTFEVFFNYGVELLGLTT